MPQQQRTVLMVAEKPSLAKSLAHILSSGNAVARSGRTRSCPVHEYNGKFEGSPARFKFTSVCGHVMSIDFLPQYNNWDATRPVELFSAPTEKSESSPKAHLVDHLRSEARGCDDLVLWLDCDREGENICFEVIDACASVMTQRSSSMSSSSSGRRGGGRRTIHRAKFSAITETEVRGAMASLGEPNRNEALAVDARQELDLRVGCAFTRFQTRFFQGLYGDLDASLVSYGPCQTPTLGLVVERHDRIRTFTPEKYWVLDVRVDIKGLAVSLEWDRGRLFDRSAAQVFLDAVVAQGQLKVRSVVHKERSRARPVALNTVELMRVASSGLGMSPHHAMQVAERLYTQGYISYPRTETSCYAPSFDLRSVLKQQRSAAGWGAYCGTLLDGAMVHPRRGTDAGDHPPITPTQCARQGELTGDAWRVYDLVARHFVASVSPDCRYKTTTLTFQTAMAAGGVDGESFTAKGQELIDPGFTSVMHWLAPDETKVVPEVSKDDVFKLVKGSRLDERLTSPPGYLTEAELITQMEKHGIGTDASIPVHINNICERNYVTVAAGRRLVPTDLGIVLVHGYYKIDPDLVLPTMRSSVEEQLDLIAKGRVDHLDVLAHAIDIFKRKFEYFEKHIGGMDELFEVSFTPLSETGKRISRCGKCARFLTLIQAKPTRLHCQHCNDTYTMPPNGKIMLFKEIKCPLDGFELVLHSTGTRGKSYPLCPYCYNHPPFDNMEKHQGCNQCTHPTCSHSMMQHGVAPCIECDPGVLVLDPNSAPAWKMACNKCNVVVRLIESAHKIATRPGDICEACGSTRLDVDFNKAKTPLEGGRTDFIGCLFCEPVLNQLISLKHAVQRHPMYRRGRGGRGRGRRGRGRGRGKGPKGKMAELDAYFV